jgi:hypothetical protein
MACNGT